MCAIDLMDRYPEDVRHHCCRVARIIFDKIVALPHLDDTQYLAWMQVALLHDILEDTNTTPDELPEAARDDVLTLTRKDSETYFEYIDRVKNSGSVHAITVKIADLYDHLEQKDTLKDSLKDRYLKALDQLENSII